jgi:CRP-like cAMP-binding protein
MNLDADTLRRAPAFAALPTEACDALGRCFRGRRLLAGDVLFSQGDPAESLFFVAEGQIQVSARVGAVSGKQAHLGPGQLLGAAALIDHSPRSATVKATRASVVYEFDKDDLPILQSVAPAAARALVGAGIAGVVRRLRHLEHRIERELDRGGVLP